jgi:hypothetical protein
MRGVTDQHLLWSDAREADVAAAAVLRKSSIDAAPHYMTAGETCLGLKASSRRACPIGHR